MDAMDASVDYNMPYPPFHDENILLVWLNQLYLLHAWYGLTTTVYGHCRASFHTWGVYSWW